MILPRSQSFSAQLRLDLTVAGTAEASPTPRLHDPSAAARVAAVYYTLDGSTPSVHNHAGGGAPPLSLTIRRSCLVRACSVNAQGHTLAHASESYEDTGELRGAALERDAGWRERAPAGGGAGRSARREASSPQRLTGAAGDHSDAEAGRGGGGLRGAVGGQSILDGLRSGQASDGGQTPRNGNEEGSIGLLLEKHNLTGKVAVKRLMPGGPADREASLVAGDRCPCPARARAPSPPPPPPPRAGADRRGAGGRGAGCLRWTACP
jgi:hypothetical protein